MEQLIDRLNDGIIEDEKRSLFEEEAKHEFEDAKKDFQKQFEQDRRNLDNIMRQKLKNAV